MADLGLILCGKSSLLLSFLEACTIFSLFFVFDNTEVGVITAFADVVLVDGFKHGAAGFVAMCAVAIFTIGRELENLGEVVPDLGLLHVEGSKSLNAGRVDDVAVVAAQREHLAEGRGVHPFQVRLRDFACLGVSFGDDGVDECGFSNTRVAGEECYLLLQFLCDSLSLIMGIRIIQ